MCGWYAFMIVQAPMVQKNVSVSVNMIQAGELNGTTIAASEGAVTSTKPVNTTKRALRKCSARVWGAKIVFYRPVLHWQESA